jgi:hypothetical protein
MSALVRKQRRDFKFHSAQRHLHFLDTGCVRRASRVATWPRRVLSGAAVIVTTSGALALVLATGLQSAAATSATWTAATLPTTGLNPAADSSTNVNPGVISCVSASSCVAAGYYTDTSGNTDGFAETLSGGTWTAATLPTTGLNPAASPSTYMQPFGVSCSSAGSCVAVGYYTDASGNGDAFAETLSGGTWTAATLPTAGLNPAASPSTFMRSTGVSCSSAGSCVAVGWYLDTSGNIDGFTETLSGGTWTAVTLPTTGLNPASDSSNVKPFGVSCPSAGSCVAVGYYTDTSGNIDGFAETLSEGTWTAATLPTTGLNPAANSSTNVDPGAISCVSASSCVAVGYYTDTSGNIDGFAETLSEGTWTAATLPTTGLNPAASPSTFMWPLGISCVSAGSCTSVGGYRDVSGNGDSFAETLSGGTWTAVTLPTTGLNPASNSSARVFATSVSCPSTNVCITIGLYNDSSGNMDGFTETESAPATTVAPPDIPTSISISVSPNPATTGEPVEITATVSGGNPLPGGAVTFYDGSTALGLSLLSGNTATFSTSSLNVGAHLISANYSGWGVFAPSYSGSVLLVVHSAAPPTTVPPTSCPTGQSGTPPDCNPPSQPPPGPGYLVVTALGEVDAFGSATFFGSCPAMDSGCKWLNAPVVGVAETSDPQGYWLTGTNGGVIGYGGVGFFGSCPIPGSGCTQLNAPIVGIVSTSDSQGYWLAGADGGVFAFGDAGFFGSCPAVGSGCTQLNAPVVGIASTPDSRGYWLVAADGGVFAFGDAVFAGSAVGNATGSPIVAIAAASGSGYWVVSTNGNVDAFGTAARLPSCPNVGPWCNHLAAPIVRIQATPNGQGYWLFGADGGVFTFGDAPFLGSAAGKIAGTSAI